PGGISAAEVQTTVKDQSGKTVAQQHTSVQLQIGSEVQMLGDIRVSKPNMWSPDDPYLYTLEVAVIQGGDTAVTTERIGFRSFEFVRSGPFKLNGNRLLLRGTHRHEDHADVG